MRRFLFFATLILALCVTTDTEAKKMKFKNGDVYEGEIVKGVIVGPGVMTYANGDVYIGIWEAGKQSGKGVMTYANGDKYDGEWSDGKQTQEGVMIYSNGDYYSGSWRNGRLYYGSMTYANGDKYDGEWSVGKPFGEGQMTYANGNTYNGNWSNGKTKGYGTFFNKETMRDYIGYWLDDEVIDTSKAVQIIYYSTVYMSDNNQRLDKYVGKIKNNMRNGYGTLTLRNNDTYACQWIDDEIDESKKVKITYAGGYTYVGEVKNCQRNSQGVFSCGNVEISGEWSDDLFVNGTGVVKHSDEECDFTILSVADNIAHVRYAYDETINIDLYLKMTNFSSWGVSIDNSKKQRAEDIKQKIEEEQRMQAEAVKRKKLAQIKANAKYYVWKDTELASINKANPARLRTLLQKDGYGFKSTIIQGVVEDIKEFEETEYNEFFANVNHATGHQLFDPFKKEKYYIVQLDGVAIRSYNETNISQITIGKYIYVDAYYSNETFFTDKYPLFSGGVYTSLNGAVNQILEYKENLLDDYARCPYRK